MNLAENICSYPIKKNSQTCCNLLDCFSCYNLLIYSNSMATIDLEGIIIIK